MEEGLIKVTPNKEKAKSILKMVDSTIDMIKDIDVAKFSSNVTKEYYDVIRGLTSVVLLLDGYKTYGEGAHKKLIDYIQAKYKEFSEYEILLIDDLRITRNICHWLFTEPTPAKWGEGSMTQENRSFPSNICSNIIFQ